MPNAEPAKDNPKVIEKQLEQVEKGDHEFDVPAAKGKFRFEPERGLPVWIDYRQPKDPFELYEKVTYQSGAVNLEMPAGFKCDAASSPWFLWLLPAIPQLLIAVLWYLDMTPQSLVACWTVGIVLSVFLPWVMPGVGQLGLHARGVFAHDAMYRLQTNARVVCDATFMEIMEHDRVPTITRWLIYMSVRLFGGRAWRKNAVMIAEKKRAQLAGEILPLTEDRSVEPISVVVSDVPKNSEAAPTTRR